ncbi:MAG: hypothetical protein V5A79_04185 [Candidatus Bipolaricaulota bacterium]
MPSLKELAELTGRRYDELSSFEADQEVTAGGLRIKGHVKFRKPRSVVVEYEEYQNPFEDFEIKVSGGPEFSGDDLVNSRVIYEGKTTWIHLLNKGTAYKKQGKRLGSPFTGVDIVGQLGFLPDLVRDFLLKGEGEGEIDGRPVDRIGIKPKSSRRSLFLKDEVFNLDRAELAIDRELGLPLKITYYPGQEEQLRYPASQGGPVFVEYSDFEIDELGRKDFQFDPSKVDKVFEENLVSVEEFEEEFPVSVPFSDLREKGYQPARDEISVNVDRDNERAFSSLVFIESGEDGGRPSSSIQILAGNFLSREMSRHRSFLSEGGEEVEWEGVTGRLVDRGETVKEQLPEELEREIYEVGWQKDESFYYLLGQGVGRDKLVEIAGSFLQ